MKTVSTVRVGICLAYRTFAICRIADLQSAGPLVLSAQDGPADLTVEIIDYPNMKSWGDSSITLGVTNHFCFKSQRVAAISVEQVSTSFSTSLRSDVTLAPGDGEHIKVLRPENRGRWRVSVWVCPHWRERLDNSIMRKLHLRFLWATYRGTYSGWIDD